MRFAAALLTSLLVGSPGIAQEAAAVSVAKRFTVALEAAEKPTPINVMHSRVVRITRSDGQAVEDATIRIDGGMKARGRDLPTAPQVTRYLGQGRYLIEGLKFNMSGKWELSLSIEAAGQADSTILGLVVR